METGRQDGTREAYDEQRRLLDAEIQELQNNISEVLQSVTAEKEKLLEQYVDDLKRISLTVAEKVIQTSLQSSGDIVKRMILAATDKITKKQWAKIYITKCDTAVSMDVDTEFLDKYHKMMGKFQFFQKCPRVRTSTVTTSDCFPAPDAGKGFQTCWPHRGDNGNQSICRTGI